MWMPPESHFARTSEPIHSMLISPESVSHSTGPSTPSMRMSPASANARISVSAGAVISTSRLMPRSSQRSVTSPIPISFPSCLTGGSASILRILSPGAPPTNKPMNTGDRARSTPRTRTEPASPRITRMTPEWTLTSRLTRPVTVSVRSKVPSIRSRVGFIGIEHIRSPPRPAPENRRMPGLVA
jgi:hypothetical protein